MRDSKTRLWAGIRRFPFTLWALLALVLHASILVLDLPYDQGGIGGLLVLSSPIWGLMYWLPSELLFTVSGGTAIQGQWLVSVIAGLTLCLLADFIVHRIWRRSEPSEPEGDSSEPAGRGFRSFRS